MEVEGGNISCGFVSYRKGNKNKKRYLGLELEDTFFSFDSKVENKKGLGHAFSCGAMAVLRICVICI